MPFKILLNKIIQDHPTLSFVKSKEHKWSASTKTIYYIDSKDTTHAIASLLHEVAHANLEHDDFSFDIELVQKEQEAWQYAQQVLAPRYKTIISSELKEDAIDSYRDWLHERSSCPDCGVNAIQTKTGTYKCFACGCQWRANQAINCQLRRYRLPVYSQ